MPFFKLSRDKVVPTLSGNVIEFKKDEKTWVPTSAVGDVLAIGAQPLDADFEAPADKGITTTNSGIELNPEARKEAILDAFKTMETRANRDDFTAGGKPQAKVVSQLVGFTVDARESGVLWAEYKQSDE